MTTPTELVPGTELPSEKDEDLKLLVNQIMGFVYMSNSLNAIVDTVRVLRANPELARRLLDLS